MSLDYNTAKPPDPPKRAKAKCRAVGKILIQDCPRCHGEHRPLGVYPLTNPHGSATHYAECPTLREPIMLGDSLD